MRWLDSDRAQSLIAWGVAFVATIAFYLALAVMAFFLPGCSQYSPDDVAQIAITPEVEAYVGDCFDRHMEGVEHIESCLDRMSMVLDDVSGGYYEVTR